MIWKYARCFFQISDTPITRPIFSGDSPEDLKTVIITDYGKSDKIEDIEYSKWTADTWQRLDYQGNVLESKPNIYKIIWLLKRRTLRKERNKFSHP